MSLALVAFLLLAAAPADDEPVQAGNEPSPIVLVVENAHVDRTFGPLDDVIFGADSRRIFEYEFVEGHVSGLVRRRVRPEEDGESPGPAIPLGLKGPVPGGGPCLVLDMAPGQQAIAKGVKITLRLAIVQPGKLRDAFGPGVYEGDAWLEFRPRNPHDTLRGPRRHLIRLRLVIPGRRAVQPSLVGTLAVGQRVEVKVAVEDVFAGRADEGEAASPADRLHVAIRPEGEGEVLLKLPWPVPAGAWDPRNPGARGERANWAFPSAWLDEPVLAVAPDPPSETPVDGSSARSVIHRQALRLPALFAPGTIAATILPAGAKPETSAEARVRSGLRAGPALAFVGEPIALRAALARASDGASGEPPDAIKVRVDFPSGEAKTYELKRDGRSVGFASYEIKAPDAVRRRKLWPIASAPGYYRISPDTGSPALNAALGDQVMVFAALEKNDAPLVERERVAFLGTTPIHWPLIVWLASGRKDGAMHRADTSQALAVRAARGPEEIANLSLQVSRIAAPSRQRDHEDEKDGEVRFTLPGEKKDGKGPAARPEKGVQGPWPFDRKWTSLDLGVDIKSAAGGKPPLPKGLRERDARFLIVGVGPDRAMIGRIFTEKISYVVASHWDYYLEWAWLPGLILVAIVIWIIIRRRGAGAKKAAKHFPAPAASAPRDPSRGKGYFEGTWTEPEVRPPPAPAPEPSRRDLPSDPGPPTTGGGRYFP